METSNDTLATLEFSFVRDLLADRAVTPMGRALALDVSPLPDPDTIARALDETDQARALLEVSGSLPLRGIDEIGPALAAARPEGSVLSGLEVLAVGRFCAVAEDVRVRAAGWRADYPLLADLAGRVPDLRTIVKALQGKIAPSGELEDAASPELARIRARIQSAKAALHTRLEAIMTRAGADKVLSDSFITERGGRFVIPVRTDAPAQVRGIVHGGSSSGATIFIEPLATVELNNDLVRLHENEAAETERVLRLWTEQIRERLDDLHGAADEIARLDLASAKGGLARDLHAVRPALGHDFELSLAGGRHPLLERTLEASGRRMVPIDLSLPRGTHTLIISGPNAGGKTVVLKTTGLLALMAHSGLHVPADEARFPYLEQVLVDIGDRQSIEGSLSTFSAHVQNLSSMLRHLAAPALVLIDEIGTGTDPVEGGALAIALLETFRRTGATTIATTHHGPVKVYGIETDGVASASVEFDELTLTPTYRLLQGIAGASSGLEIAERLGLDPRVVADARRRIRPEDRAGETYLRNLKELVATLEADRGELEKMRVRLEEDARKARAEAIRSDHERAERFRGELSAALEEFRAGAREHLKGVADKKDAIRLDKERAQREAQLRREFETITRAAAPAEPLPEGGRAGGTRTGRRAGRSASRAGPAGLDRSAAGASPEAPFALAPGARVLVGPFGRVGVVESLEGDMATVLVGSARFRVRAAECLPPEGPEAPPAHDWRSARPAGGLQARGKEGVGSEINVIGLTVEEGLERVDKFLDDAVLAGSPEVRVIHGHGTGRLRTAIRERLSHHPHVDSHRPGGPSEGGNGATVATLNV